MFIMNGYDRKANTWCPWTSCCILYSKQRINASRCMDCYPTIIGKEFLLSLLAVTSNEAKMLSLKIGLLSLGVYYVAMVLANGKDFLYFAKKCKQVYSLLPHHYWQGFFALDCCSVTSNEFPLKMGLPSLQVAFSQARYSFLRDS